MKQLSVDAMLGLDFLESHKSVISVATHTITLDNSITIPLFAGQCTQDASQPNGAVSIACIGTVQVPPHSEMMLEGITQHLVKGTYSVEPSPVTRNSCLFPHPDG